MLKRLMHITLYHVPSPRAPWFDRDMAHACPTNPGSPPWKQEDTGEWCFFKGSYGSV